MESVKKTKKMFKDRSVPLIGVIDIGTTTIKFILFSIDGDVVQESYKPIRQIYPNKGWVEEDPIEMWDAVNSVVKHGLDKVDIDRVKSLGICNQRESTLVWNKSNGKPLSNVVVWQDRRTSKRCNELKNQGLERLIKEKTGLILDPYFSATKLEWILNNENSLLRIAQQGKLCFGTVDSWIIFKLTGLHLTDFSNASRTLLFNINSLEWDQELLKIFGIPSSILPKVMPSFGYSVFGHTTNESVFKKEIPICSDLGDQQSALFGQQCFSKGDIKSTFGTGSFMLVNTGNRIIKSNNNLLTTIFYGSSNKEIFYALEASIYNAGSVLQWLKEEINLINKYDEIETISPKYNYDDKLFFVPAFTGLGAPFWDPYARGLIIGLTRSTSKQDIIKAALESLAYRTEDVLQAIEKDTGFKISEIRIDGGVTKSKIFCKILADLTGVSVKVYKFKEFTALGAMYAAAIGIGIWNNPGDISGLKDIVIYEPKISSKVRANLYKNWSRAVARAQKWEKI